MLSEYIDGRLSVAVTARTERHLAACQRCNGELESLQHAVGLLRQVPQTQPRRSFTFASPPVPAQAPHFRPVFRPQWAYGAAASMAVLLFAAVLTADLSGTLEPETATSSAADQATEAATKATAPAESQDEVQNAVSVAAGESALDDLALAEGGPDLMMSREAAEVEAIAAAEPVQSDLQALEYDEVAAAAPILPPAVEGAEAEFVISAPVESAIPLPEAATYSAALPVPEAATESTALDVELAKETPPPQVIQLLPTPEGEDGGTHLGWRVLEALSGAAAVVLTGAILWRRRRRSRTA